MSDDAEKIQGESFGWGNKPTPDAIIKRTLDNRNVDYTKLIAPVGSQVSLQGDPQLGISGVAVGIMSNVQQFLGNSGTYFSKSQQSEANFGAVNINEFSCDCGGKNSFKVVQNVSEYRSKVVKCVSCGAIYGVIPENVHSIISSPAASAMTKNEILRIILRQPKTNMYIIFQSGK